MNEPLKAFVDDRSGFRAEPAKSLEDGFEIALEAGVWRGIPWHHTISCAVPAGNNARTCLLIATGGDLNADDEDEARELGRLSGLPVATLYQIPNQPIWDLREDDLIAMTFDRFLETRELDWPLLFPMVRSCVRAMDALQMATDGQFDRFIVTGASKRGWTTWLVSTLGDPRVAGVAPVVFDFLDIPRQMARQSELFGAPSEKLRSYTERELDEQSDSQAGHELVQLVDPFAHRDAIQAPTLAIIGSNDPYWATDASSIYWNALPQPRSLLVMLQQGHVFSDKGLYLTALARFARHIADGLPWPPAGGDVVERFAAGSQSSDLREAVWDGDIQGAKFVARFERRYGQASAGPIPLDSPISVTRIV